MSDKAWSKVEGKPNNKKNNRWNSLQNSDGDRDERNRNRSGRDKDTWRPNSRGSRGSSSRFNWESGTRSGGKGYQDNERNYNKNGKGRDSDRGNKNGKGRDRGSNNERGNVKKKQSDKAPNGVYINHPFFTSLPKDNRCESCPGRPCHHYFTGTCSKGDDCGFCHNDHHLEQLKQDISSSELLVDGKLTKKNFKIWSAVLVNKDPDVTWSQNTKVNDVIANSVINSINGISSEKNITIKLLKENIMFLRCDNDDPGIVIPANPKFILMLNEKSSSYMKFRKEMKWNANMGYIFVNNPSDEFQCKGIRLSLSSMVTSGKWCIKKLFEDGFRRILINYMTGITKPIPAQHLRNEWPNLVGILEYIHRCELPWVNSDGELFSDDKFIDGRMMKVIDFHINQNLQNVETSSSIYKIFRDFFAISEDPVYDFEGKFIKITSEYMSKDLSKKIECSYNDLNAFWNLLKGMDLVFTTDTGSAFSDFGILYDVKNWKIDNPEIKEYINTIYDELFRYKRDMMLKVDFLNTVRSVIERLCLGILDSIQKYAWEVHNQLIFGANPLKNYW